MPSKITQSNLPPNSWQGLNSPYTLPKSIFSDNTAIMMGNHCLFLHFSILFQSNSPDLRILYLTPPSQANYISSTHQTLPKRIFSDNTAIMMDDHRLFLHISTLFQSNSPDLRILQIILVITRTHGEHLVDTIRYMITLQFTRLNLIIQQSPYPYTITPQFTRLNLIIQQSS